jgi:hypothetical protein
MNNVTLWEAGFALAIIAPCLILGLVFIRDWLSRLRADPMSLPPDTKERRVTGLGMVPRVLLSMLFLGYGLRALLTGAVFVPSRTPHSTIHMQGAAAVIFFLASLCATAFVIGGALHASDAKMRQYRFFMCATALLAWTLLGLSLAVNVLFKIRQM